MLPKGQLDPIGRDSVERRHHQVASERLAVLVMAGSPLQDLDYKLRGPVQGIPRGVSL